MAYQVYKKDQDISYSFGVYPTIELLHHKVNTVRKILLHSKGMNNTGVDLILDLCNKKGIAYEVNDKLIYKLTKKENCYAVGIFEKYNSLLMQGENHIILVNPSDMGNLGSIIRTMVGFGVTNLGIIKPAADVFDPKVIRGSMGAVFKINICEYEDIYEYRARYNNNLYSFMLNSNRTLHSAVANPHENYTLVFGNESSGLDESYHELSTSLIIPHSSDIDSLNLSVAVGIAIYHFSRVEHALEMSL
ncbi:TrmH family RNA methyltransferase [Paenibacillus assamensis]|uniref:TrmH family RNA methyltransferase n=1 Tax=Paenibacillus assamensis TaxID=311244 RepID=UPI0003F84FEF|nr:TrmH family RNA methyltransferase [Paenibacillus assamensis]